MSFAGNATKHRITKMTDKILLVVSGCIFIININWLFQGLVKSDLDVLLIIFVYFCVSESVIIREDI